MGTLQGSWIWYELMTPDPQGAREFYQAVGGWTISPGHGDQDDYSLIARADGGLTGGVLGLTAEMLSGGAKPGWLGYIAVDDLDAFLPRLQQEGGKVLMPAREVAGAGRIALVADCCGAPFYAMTPSPPPGGGPSTAFDPQQVGSCGWNELLATSDEAAVTFYTSLFGWSLPQTMDMGEHGPYHFIAHDGVQIGAIMRKGQAPAAMWTHYFRVASIPVAAEAAMARGGRIANGPMDVPGGDCIVQGYDPQGAFFSLVGKNG